MNISGHFMEVNCRASCWWSRSTGTGTTGLIQPIEAEFAALSCWRLSNYVVSGMHDELGTLG